MILADAVKKAQDSKALKEFLAAEPDYYLAHAFTMLDEKEKKYSWELGYYSQKSEKLAVFETESEIRLKVLDEAFKKEGHIEPLDMKQVLVSVAKANKACDELMSSKYPSQTITKRIIILQNLTGQVYNVTLVCMSFSIVNIKIDAKTGEVVSDNLQSIMGIGDWQKGGKSKVK